MNNAAHRIADGFRSVISYWSPTPTVSQFVERGTLTPQEFVEAGDQLTFKFPTWKWQPADCRHQVPWLPANKQYLVTCGVSCRSRVRDLDTFLPTSAAAKRGVISIVNQPAYNAETLTSSSSSISSSGRTTSASPLSPVHSTFATEGLSASSVGDHPVVGGSSSSVPSSSSSASSSWIKSPWGSKRASPRCAVSVGKGLAEFGAPKIGDLTAEASGIKRCSNRNRGRGEEPLASRSGTETPIGSRGGVDSSDLSTVGRTGSRRRQPHGVDAIPAAARDVVECFDDVDALIDDDEDEDYAIVRATLVDGPVDEVCPSRCQRSKNRSYDLSMTYDKYYQTPRLWLRGYDEHAVPLDPNSIFEDILTEYVSKTVTIDPHPCTGELTVSIHPCKHASMMRKVVHSWLAHKVKPRHDLALIVLLKFISSVIPTIQYDATLDIDGFSFNHVDTRDDGSSAESASDDYSGSDSAAYGHCRDTGASPTSG